MHEGLTMIDEPTRDEELDALLDELEGAGIVERYVNPAGDDAMRLTKQGQQIANQLALMGNDQRDEVIAALVRGDDDEASDG